VNRDGIGATILFTPEGLPSNMKSILGGSSYASQDALAAYFGMGSSTQGNVEILWPGGARNRLLNVQAGEVFSFPEIPCSIDDQFSDPGYVSCVSKALDELLIAGIIDSSMKARLLESATAMP
jgi:hypothetical protein